MKDNKVLKILFGMFGAIVIAGIVYVGVGFFGGDDNKSSEQKSSSTSTVKKEDKKQEEKVQSSTETKENTQTENTEQKNNTGQVEAVQNNNNNPTIKNNTIVGNNQNNAVQNKEYHGKKVSGNEGVGTTGKVFKSQKEAMEYGNSEIERLVKLDKKPRQFSVSKVSAEDGSVLGWTVDIFEDNSTQSNNSSKENKSN